jgi:hypothetical protein
MVLPRVLPVTQVNITVRNTAAHPNSLYNARPSSSHMLYLVILRNSDSFDKCSQAPCWARPRVLPKGFWHALCCARLVSAACLAWHPRQRFSIENIPLAPGLFGRTFCVHFNVMNDISYIFLILFYFLWPSSTRVRENVVQSIHISLYMFHVFSAWFD